jgi:hypothetical protein
MSHSVSQSASVGTKSLSTSVFITPPGSYSVIIVARIDSSALSVLILCEWLQGVAGIALESPDQKTRGVMV